MDRLSELLGSHVRFSSTCRDRIVLNGYLDRLQRPENVVDFFRAVAGEPRVTPEVLASRTGSYRASLTRYAEEHGIPVPAAPKGARKEAVVAPYHRRLRGAEEGVACILTSLEQARTFVSYAPRYEPPSGDPDYRLIRACRKRFLHDYGSVLAPVPGPMSVRIGTYRPFTVACYLDGHAFAAREPARQGVAFTRDDNAILAVADPGAPEAAAGRLTPRLLEQRGDAWVRLLGPTFSAAEQAALPLRYRCSVARLELATDVIFTRTAPPKAPFRRAVELGILVGGADRVAQLFGKRITRRYRGRVETVLTRRHEGRPALRASSRASFVKQYEERDRRLRTETCLHDTHRLGSGRSLERLPAPRARMLATNARHPDARAEPVVSPVEAGDLAALAQPRTIGKRRVPGLKPEDDRVIRPLEVPLQPGAVVADWTSREVHARLLTRHRLDATDYRLAQFRYDLGKLRAHRLVERIGTTRRSRLTTRGVKLGVLPVKRRTRLLGPLTSRAAETTPRRPSRTPGAVEAAFRQLDRALDQLCDALGLTLVA